MVCKKLNNYRIKTDIKTPFETLRAKCLDEVKLKQRFDKSLNLQISSLVGCFKKINAFLVFSILCFHKTVYNK